VDFNAPTVHYSIDVFLSNAHHQSRPGKSGRYASEMHLRPRLALGRCSSEPAGVGQFMIPRIKEGGKKTKEKKAV